VRFRKSSGSSWVLFAIPRFDDASSLNGCLQNPDWGKCSSPPGHATVEAFGLCAGMPPSESSRR
jgi:hypothetical protein